LFRQIDVARAQLRESKYQAEWRDALASRGALDYAAMLERAADLTDGGWVSTYLHRLYGHIAIDEAQNLSRLQYSFLQNVIGDSDSHIDVTVVGDERQSIVGFAGADAALIRTFERAYSAQRVELRTNFRSARAIIGAGRRVAAQLGLPNPANSREYPAPGYVECIEYRDEAAEAAGIAAWVSDLLSSGLPASAVAPGEIRMVAPEEIAVLARNAAALRLVRDSLERLHITTAQSSTEDEWVRSVTARLVLALVAYQGAPSHASTLRRISRISGCEMNARSTPYRALEGADDGDVRVLAGLEWPETPEAMMEHLQRIEEVSDADWLDDLDLLIDAHASFCDRYKVADRTFGNFNQHLARCQRGDALSEGVRLLTVHKSQGREFKAVALVACNNGQLPDFRARSDEARTAELRVFYVAISRASRLLRLTRALSRRTRYGSRTTDRSPFLDLALMS
jgi:DNA helicase-2/ATP-dependent DNA helicase PcrA